MIITQSHVFVYILEVAIMDLVYKCELIHFQFLKF